MLILLIAIYFSTLGAVGLMEPDEARYAEIPREMLASGDFVTPHLNYVKYFEKPVLHYWLTAASLKVFGQEEFSARFWPAFLALVCIVTVYYLGYSMYGRQAALLGAVVLGATLLFFVLAQINILDMPLTCFITLSLAGFWAGYNRNRRWLLLGFAGSALAVLTKGLIGFILPAGVLFWWILPWRRWSELRRSFYLPGFVLFFLIAVPWFTVASLKNPGFFHFFFIREHFLRYLTSVHQRSEPVWFFLPVLFIGFLPWTGFMLQTLWNLIRDKSIRSSMKRDAFSFLLVWAGLIFIFFTASNSKLAPYILPALPPLAILTGAFINRVFETKNIKKLRRGILLSAVCCAPLALGGFAYPFLQNETDLVPALLQTTPIGAALTLTFAATYFYSRKNRIRSALKTLVFGAMITTLAFRGLFWLYEPGHTAKDIVAVVEPVLTPTTLVAEYNTFDQGLAFYLKKRIALVDYMGELEYGATQGDQSEWFLSPEDFANLYWNTDTHVVLVAPRGSDMDFLKTTGREPVSLGRTLRREIYTNRETIQ
ncbi:MAG: phospholipid carrier-dependent glycosyltransferase [Synergistota bacterium]|nr:phospholipid carrier-dependent glycosyltransferase [Synergistota bacterium]